MRGMGDLLGSFPFFGDSPVGGSKPVECGRLASLRIIFFWRCTVDARSVANNNPVYLAFSLLPAD